MVCCEFFVAHIAISFPAAVAGTGFRFSVALIAGTRTGMGAVAIAYPHFPAVLAQVRFAIFGPADHAHGRRYAIRLQKVAAGSWINMTAVALADTAVGFIACGFPDAPVMPQLV